MKALPFYIGVALLVGIAVLTYLNISDFMQNIRGRSAIRSRVIMCDRCTIALMDAETSKRGYLLTQNTEYLQRFDGATKRMREQLEKLKAEFPAGDESILELLKLSDAKLDQMRKTIELSREGRRDEVTAIINSDLATHLLDKFRASIDSTVESLESKLAEADRLLESSGRRTLWTLSGGGVLAVGLLAYSYSMLKKENSARLAAEEATRELNRGLEAKVDERTRELAAANQTLKHEIEEHAQARRQIEHFNAELEGRVRERTAELETANKELESFSYSVSHDLRAPLRHVDGFVDLLQKHAGETLDEKGLRYLRIISDSARQMGRLIDDLLAFSRTSRAEVRKTAVDLGALVSQVRSELTGAGRDGSAEWKISRLPVVHADSGLLRLVMMNLLDNALKYSRKSESPVIEVAAEAAKNETVISVRDNGVGFDMQYSGKLFGVFQRLHRADEFEGTGIGLATVKRIVARHGGRIWAQSAPERGATFNFSLPNATETEGTDGNAQNDPPGRG